MRLRVQEKFNFIGVLNFDVQTGSGSNLILKTMSGSAHILKTGSGYVFISKTGYGSSALNWSCCCKELLLYSRLSFYFSVCSLSAFASIDSVCMFFLRFFSFFFCKYAATRKIDRKKTILAAMLLAKNSPPALSYVPKWIRRYVMEFIVCVWTLLAYQKILTKQIQNSGYKVSSLFEIS